MSEKKFTDIVIGAGFAGATAARCLADAGRKVLLLERRPHIGGNAYDENDENGILIHRYGPHIFHTNNERVYRFLTRFGGFTDYSHRVAARLGDKLVPVPFNLTSIDMIYGERAAAIQKKLLEHYAPEQKIPVYELTKQDDPELSELAMFIYNNVFKYYTEKQWGVSPDKVSKETLSRVPVFLSRDDRYFQDRFQGMPVDGYTALIENMLNSEGITVETGVDGKSRLGFSDGKLYFDNEPFSGEVIYTGAADELFDNKYGALPYRTLDFVFETHKVDSYQEYGTVNYTVSEKFTRITEFKHLTGQIKPGVTTIMKEYSRAFRGGSDIPYYAILDPENTAIYEKYAADAAAYGKLHLLGRLAEYRYYNMDATVANALELTDRLCRK